MPATVNGIGTHNYGKKNRSVRNGACRSCHRVVDLESYDTRLWFVVVFIPVIPLGRKRILDSCPVCRRHYAADQDQYAMSRQLSLSGARDQFRSDPTPEAAIEAHAQMLGFHAHDDAKTFRDEALAKISDDATLYAAFGSQLDEVNEYDRATPMFEKAYQLDSLLPHARDGMALRKIVDGKLDDARQLLNFLEQPGAGQLYSMGRLEQLAGAYQKAGRHEETLALAEHLVREFPHVADHRQFRKFVEKSEKATHRTSSVLPKRKASWRALFDTRSGAYSQGQRFAAYAGIAAALIVIGLVALNEYRRQHRTVHVRNEFGPDAKVVIDGNIAVPPGAQEEVVLGEGKHHVSVTGAIDEEFDIDVATDYWKRWTDSPAWVINVGGAAQLLNEKVFYAVNPRPSEPTLVAGENVLFLPHVDYLFESSPESLDVGSSSGEVVKRQLLIAHEAPRDVFEHVRKAISPEAGLRYAESRLLIDPADKDLLEGYYAVASGDAKSERVKQFLQRGFDARPVRIAWHRMFHELHPSTAEKTELIKQYDALLAKEPNNAALLYLRGRLTPSKSVAEEFYNRSIGADPQLSYPWMALGYAACTRGDWAKSTECLQKALELNYDDEILSTLQIARLGLGEGESLEREYREQIASTDPNDALPSVMRLSMTLVARGDAAGAKRVLNDWESKIQGSDDVRTILENYRGLIDFMTGDQAAVEQRVSAGTVSPDLKLLYLLVAGKPAEAAGDAALDPFLDDPWNALALSLSYDLAGQPSEAQVWRAKAADVLGQLDFDEVRAAEKLRSNQPPMPSDFDNVGILPSQKALLIAALATRFPEQHDVLATLAKHFDVQPSAYGPLVRQAIAHRP